jgi:hypothetical protein
MVVDAWCLRVSLPQDLSSGSGSVEGALLGRPGGR